MKFYKGDIIQKELDPRGINIKMLSASELEGVRADSNIDGYVLFHRPLSNYIKNIWHNFKSRL